ncbi:MAG: uracil-DNA glycosylase [Verrucomicrobiota bacterium]|jgi:DNA polymerase
MSHYQDALEAAEAHLRALQANGVRFLNVQAETLLALQQPVPEQPDLVALENAVAVESVPALNLNPNPTVTAEKQAAPEPVTARQSLALPGLVAAEKQAAPEPVAARQVGTLPKLSAAERQAAMAALRERATACVKCPHLARSRRTVVFGTGDIHARLMFVGEAPGADEDARGEPFVGAAGQLLTRIIKAMGFSRETVYIANILKCRPDTPGQSYGNRKPAPEEMRTCLPWLLEQIDLVRPEVMVALGATAVEGLLGKGEGISKLRGRFQTFHGVPVMPTFHPSYLLRNQAVTEKRKVWEDMMQVLEKLGAPISEKQRGFFLKA